MGSLFQPSIMVLPKIQTMVKALIHTKNGENQERETKAVQTGIQGQNRDIRQAGPRHIPIFRWCVHLT